MFTQVMQFYRKTWREHQRAWICFHFANYDSIFLRVLKIKSCALCVKNEIFPSHVSNWCIFDNLFSFLTICRRRMYSVVSHLYNKPQRQKRTNKGRKQDLSCPSRFLGYIRKRFNQDKGGEGGLSFQFSPLLPHFPSHLAHTRSSHVLNSRLCTMTFQLFEFV